MQAVKRRGYRHFVNKAVIASILGAGFVAPGFTFSGSPPEPNSGTPPAWAGESKDNASGQIITTNRTGNPIITVRAPATSSSFHKHSASHEEPFVPVSAAELIAVAKKSRQWVITSVEPRVGYAILTLKSPKGEDRIKLPVSPHMLNAAKAQEGAVLTAVISQTSEAEQVTFNKNGIPIGFMSNNTKSVQAPASQHVPDPEQDRLSVLPPGVDPDKLIPLPKVFQRIHKPESAPAVRPETGPAL